MALPAGRRFGDPSRGGGQTGAGPAPATTEHTPVALMAQFADALRAPNEEINQAAEEMQKNDDEHPDDFRIVVGRFVFDATDQGQNPDGGSSNRNEEEKAKKEQVEQSDAQ